MTTPATPEDPRMTAACSAARISDELWQAASAADPATALRARRVIAAEILDAARGLTAGPDRSIPDDACRASKMDDGSSSAASPRTSALTWRLPG